MIRTRINFGLKTTKGKRAVNQDSLVCTYNQNSDFIGVVCDGVGSVAHSEVASKLLCKVFASDFEQTKIIDKPIIWAKKTLEKALNHLKHISEMNSTPGISTTLALLLIVEGKYYALNIGDTRIYGIKKDKSIDLLTTDHNYYNFLVKKGVHNRTLNINKNKWFALTRYVDATKPEKAKFDYVYGDSNEYKYFLICTDGLYSFIDNKKMVRIAKAKCLPLNLRSWKLNNVASSNKSKDNISNILVSCKTYGK